MGSARAWKNVLVRQWVPRNAPATVGRPGLKDAMDDMSVANLDPDHDGLITGKPTLDEAA